MRMRAEKSRGLWGLRRKPVEIFIKRRGAQLRWIPVLKSSRRFLHGVADQDHERQREGSRPATVCISNFLRLQMGPFPTLTNVWAANLAIYYSVQALPSGWADKVGLRPSYNLQNPAQPAAPLRYPLTSKHGSGSRVQHLHTAGRTSRRSRRTNSRPRVRDPGRRTMHGGMRAAAAPTSSLHPDPAPLSRYIPTLPPLDSSSATRQRRWLRGGASCCSCWCWPRPLPARRMGSGTR